MKYIPAEKLIKFKEALADIIVSSQGICTYQDCKDIAEREAPILISSLHQEQPEVDVNLGEPNADLSEEIENFCLEYDARKEAWYNMLPKDQKLTYSPTWQNFATNLAYHFYNRGYNARKEESK